MAAPRSAGVEVGARWALLATGDFALEDVVRSPSLRDGEFQALVGPVVREAFAGADLSVVNLEAPLRGTGGAAEKVGPAIALDPGALDVLSRLGVGVATLANNHAMDFGWRGLAGTIEACRSRGIGTCGAGADAGAALGWTERVVAGGVRVRVISVCEAEFGIAGARAPGTAGISHPMVGATVRAARAACDAVVVAAHGGVEYAPVSPVQRREQLRALVDAGASCVIGNHPHVPQGWEFYNGGLIFHSLGNFLLRFRHSGRGRSGWSVLPRLALAGGRVVGFEPMIVAVDGAGRVERLTDFSSLPGNPVEYLRGLSAIVSDDGAYPGVWAAAADFLWREKYGRVFADAVGDAPGSRLRAALRPAVRAVRGWRTGSAAAKMSEDRWRRLLLTNLLRAESHRWTIEAAQSGDRPTESDRRRVAELFRWTW